MVRLQPILWWISYSVSCFFTRAALRIRFEGCLDPRRPPAVVTGKHVSYWDIPLVAMAVRRVFRTYPHFEMGTFAGYPILGRVSWYLERLGGFPVMRPKDVLRLRRTYGERRAELSALMTKVNDRARSVRENVLKAGHVLCYFPEGTRNRAQVLKFRSRHEIEEAKALGIPDLVVMPVVPCYGPKRRFIVPFLLRRDVTVRVLEVIDVAGGAAGEILERAQVAVESAFVTAEAEA